MADIDIAIYRGIGQFGPAYKVMLENDCHVPGSVDRVLLDEMVRICPETVRYLYEEHTPTAVQYAKGSRPELEDHVMTAISGCGTVEEHIEGITCFCRSLADKADTCPMDELQTGGTEEQIIARGTDWCTDLARVGCAMCQVAGIPARIVYLADTDTAYSGHAIIEAYRDGIWGAVDTTTGVIYRHPNGRPATTRELMNDPSLIEQQQGFYSTSGQFRAACVANYFVWDWRGYDYTVVSYSDFPEYYRTILDMSAQGWPGGLRWVFGEDGSY